MFLRSNAPISVPVLCSTYASETQIINATPTKEA